MQDCPFDIPTKTGKDTTGRKKKKRSVKKKQPKFVEDTFGTNLQVILDKLKIETWDLVLVGDGSGSTWANGCGWASIAIKKNTFNREVFFGSMSHGTNNIGEMMAYLQPLMWYQAMEKKRRKETGASPRTHQVHILTDSDYCRQRGSGHTRDFKKNLHMWTAFDVIQRSGFILHWHWIRRESIGLNVYADNLSRESRLLLKEAKLQEKVEASGIHPNVDECNPL